MNMIRIATMLVCIATFSGSAIAQTEPDTPAPTPTVPEANVISLFSNAYTNATVDTWSADWDDADVEDVQLSGDDVKKYTNLVFAGIEFTSQTVDASAMTHFHMDIWTPDPTADPAVLKVKLVDFGADGAYAGGDDVEHELTFSSSTTPAIATGSWVSLKIPLTAFTGLTTTGHLAQMVISGDPNTVFVDNVYFSKAETAMEPDAPAPTPTLPSEDVISLFSNAYTNVTVDTWSADWDNADVEDVQIGGDDTKKYSNLVFAGIEFSSETIDASNMTHMHMDIWTPDPTDPPVAFLVKLVDFGADGAFGGGDDVEHEISVTGASTPPLATGSWVSVDVPLALFTGLTTKAHLAQIVLSGDLNTVFIDNLYFYEGGAPTAPVTAAPTPTVDAANVISLYSNAYTDVPVDTWSAEWDNADVEDVQIEGNDTKRYSNVVFAGVEFTTQTIDASSMTHFHMDIWTPDPTADPAMFKIKLVDFGADGVFGGGDDVEHEVTLSDATTPALATGSWVSIEIPLTDFTGLTTKAHLAQMVLSGDLPTVFVDNVYFHEVVSELEPAIAAPTPTQAEEDVVSLFSNAYTDVTVDTWSAEWDNADVEDMQIAGDDTKKYTNLVFAGIEFTTQTVDASGMTHFHMDIWTPNETAEPAVFKIKIVDFGPDGAFGGGDDVEDELTFSAATTPALETGSWVSMDIPLDDFAAMTTRGHIAQLIISGDLSTVYVDNVYFWGSATDVRISPEASGFVLEQNYPNPFNPSTTIEYSLDVSDHVTLRVYTTQGEQIATLVDAWRPAGSYRSSFDATGLPSGTYLYTLTIGAHTSTRKMQLIR